MVRPGVGVSLGVGVGIGIGTRRAVDSVSRHVGATQNLPIYSLKGTLYSPCSPSISVGSQG